MFLIKERGCIVCHVGTELLNQTTTEEIVEDLNVDERIVREKIIRKKNGRPCTRFISLGNKNEFGAIELHDLRQIP